MHDEMSTLFCAVRPAPSERMAPIGIGQPAQGTVSAPPAAPARRGLRLAEVALLWAAAASTAGVLILLARLG
jgi:hypothetical protein